MKYCPETPQKKKKKKKHFEQGEQKGEWRCFLSFFFTYLRLGFCRKTLRGGFRWWRRRSSRALRHFLLLPYPSFSARSISCPVSMHRTLPDDGNSSKWTSPRNNMSSPCFYSFLIPLFLCFLSMYLSIFSLLCFLLSSSVSPLFSFSLSFPISYKT